MLGCKIRRTARRLHRELLKPARNFNGAAVAEQAADFPQNDRNGIGGKTQAAFGLEMIDGFDKPHASGLIQIVIFDTAASKPSGAGVNQSDSFSDKFISCHSSCAG